VKRTAIALCLLLSLPGCDGFAKERNLLDRRQHNVVLVVVDSLRADRLGAYGHDRGASPRIDGLAAEGVTFERAQTAATWTLPSVASMFTGLHPLSHGAYNASEKLADPHVTLAETLGLFGYTTAGFVSGIFLNSQFGLSQGFSTWSDIPVDFSSKGPRPPRKTSDVLMPEVLDWLEAHKRDRFFLFVHLMDVHPPLDLPADGDTRVYDPDYSGVWDQESLDLRIKKRTFGRLIHRKGGGSIMMSAADVAHLNARYDAGVQYSDRYFGQLLDALEKHGLDDETIVILTADHGLDLLDHNTLFSYPSQAPYEEISHVPLIVRHPDGPKGLRVKDPVSLVDLVPTLLDMLGLPANSGAEGRTILPAMLEEPLPPVDLFCFGSPEREPEPDRMTMSIERGGKKLLTHSLAPFDFFTTELYDIVQDPGERHDLALTDHQTLGELQQALHRFVRQRGGDGLYNPPRGKSGEGH
jgi:arylsulfatase A-like enzyme